MSRFIRRPLVRRMSNADGRMIYIFASTERTRAGATATVVVVVASLRKVGFPRAESVPRVKYDTDPDETCIRDERNETSARNARGSSLIIALDDASGTRIAITCGYGP